MSSFSVWQKVVCGMNKQKAIVANKTKVILRLNFNSFMLFLPFHNRILDVLMSQLFRRRNTPDPLFGGRTLAFRRRAKRQSGNDKQCASRARLQRVVELCGGLLLLEVSNSDAAPHEFLSCSIAPWCSQI